MWIGTPNGLYQYDINNDSYKRFTIPTKFQNPKIKQLYYNQEWLWCVLDSGIAALQVRLNDWLNFDTSNGLPSNFVNNMDFMGDYVWIATDKGAARFDLLIEQWEKFDESRGLENNLVYNLKTQGDKIWLATKDGFSEYDPQYEKWRYFSLEDIRQKSEVTSQKSEVTSQKSQVRSHKSEFGEYVVKRLFLGGDNIWLVTNNGLIRFNIKVQTKQLYDYPYLIGDNLIDIITVGEQIYVATKIGLYAYDGAAGVWREFEGNNYLQDYKIINAYINTNQIWILTDKNVLIWDMAQKNWEIQDYSTGLSASNYESVYSDGSLTFLFNKVSLDYRKNQQSQWRKYFISTDNGSKVEGNILKNLFDNKEGGYIPIGDYKWSFEGTRIKYILNQVKQYPSVGNNAASNSESDYRMDIKSQVNFNNSRRITGFYNNIDYSETMYGIRFRGNDSDFIREVNWGDFRREPGTIPFGESVNLFGNNIWLQYGDKTEKFKRSLFTLKASTGEMRTKKTYEYYQGATSEFNKKIKDMNYSKNQFYSIPGLGTSKIPSQIEIFVDDLNSANNSPNTSSHTTIAGITGDFDSWKETEDFEYYNKGKCIRFLKIINPVWTIVIRYKINNIQYEAVLQNGNMVSTTKDNFYYLSGQQIIPYSFKMQIKDSSGKVIPLNTFNISSIDEQIDSHWIDYINGILFFPVSKPFPIGVYDSANAQSYYTMEISYKTELSLIQLKHSNLVRGSELLKLDGITATAGNDYVLDYTNGTLIFVREGVLNPDTRIEIEYEYYQSNNEKLHNATLNFSPSDNFYIQTDWQRDSRKTNNLLTLHSEIRQNIGNYDIKITPGISYQTREKKMTGGSFEGLLSSSWLRFQSIIQTYTENYQNIYRPQSIFGNIKNRMEFNTTVDLLDDLRLMGNVKQLLGYDSSNGVPKDQSAMAGFLFHKQDYPGWQMSYNNIHSNMADSTIDKHFLQSNLEYQLPKSLIQNLFLQNLKIEAYHRYGFYKNNIEITTPRQQFFQYFYKLNTQFTEQIQGGIFYRRNNLNDNAKDNFPISSSERLLIDFSQEQWRLIQVNLRIENTLQQYSHKGQVEPQPNIKDYYLRQFSQINFRFSPGQAWEPLSIFFFELNMNQTANNSGYSNDNVNSYLWNIFQPGNDNAASMMLNRNYYIKNEFRPSSQWYLYSMIEWNNTESGNMASTAKYSYWRLQEKLDLRLGYETHLVFQYRQYVQDFGFNRTISDYQPSIWLEQRWTPDFQNIFNITYKYNSNKNDFIVNNSNNLDLEYDIIWRKSEIHILRNFELRQSLTGSYRETAGYNNLKNIQYGSSTSLDLYPLNSLIIRFRIDLIRFHDLILPGNDYLNLTFNLKISLQF